MNIGDLVRSLHGNEEGFITKIIDQNTIEIEIEDGFTMPILKRDVVIVKKEESEHFSSSDKTSPDNIIKPKVTADIGLFLSFIPSTENLCDIHLINNTDYDVLITLHRHTNDGTKGMHSGNITSKQTQFIRKWSLKDFDNWGKLQIDVLYFKRNEAHKPPLSTGITFQAKSFYNNLKNTPLMDVEGHIYQLDQKSSTSGINIKSVSQTTTPKINRPDKVIDLHVDESTKNEKLKSEDILQHQMRMFEQNLEAAIATSMYEITFIHGVGNQVLKSRIQKALSQHPHVEYFQDAQKNNFGYGATYVKL